MAQEFIIRDVKKAGTWHNNYGDFQSYALALTGIGEPVKMNKVMPVQVEPVIGDKLYGELHEETAQDGRMYYKFKSEPRPEEDKRQLSIEAQFSVRLAVEVYLAAGDVNQAAYANIETEARHFLTMIHNLKKEQ